MSLKSTIFALAVTMALLLPSGRLLRDNSPWTCFGFTYDETVFAQAAQNWSDGKGYRLSTTLPFDPTITVGIPLAWGASTIRAYSDNDIAQSGRLFVFGCFAILLFSIGLSALKRSGNWAAVPVSLGLFGYGLSLLPYGSYFVFGFLGETPGFLCAAFAYQALDRKKFFRAALWGTAAFVMKPSFLFLVPAVVFAAGLFSAKGFFRAGIAAAAAISGIFMAYASARNESLGSYLETFYLKSIQISQDMPAGTLIDTYQALTPALSVVTAGILIYGGIAAIRARRHAPALVAAFFLLALSSLYFLLKGIRPVEKQWSAILALTFIEFSVHLGSVISGFFRGWMPKEGTRTVVVAVIATWVVAVGPLARSHYLKTPETACASKEISAINARLRSLVDRGEATAENTGAWIIPHPYGRTLYRLGFDVPYRKDWREFVPALPKWLYGETKFLFPPPAGCAPEFKGESFALLKCEKKSEPAPPLPTRAKPIHRKAS